MEINKRVLKEIKVKRGDSHRIASRRKIEEALLRVEETQGDIYEKAALLLIGLTRAHAFDSGNRRTAYASTELFLRANEGRLKVQSEAKVLTGIREGFYETREIVEWLKGNGIRPYIRP